MSRNLDTVTHFTPPPLLSFPFQQEARERKKQAKLAAENADAKSRKMSAGTAWDKLREKLVMPVPRPPSPPQRSSVGSPGAATPATSSPDAGTTTTTTTTTTIQPDVSRRSGHATSPPAGAGAGAGTGLSSIFPQAVPEGQASDGPVADDATPPAAHVEALIAEARADVLAAQRRLDSLLKLVEKLQRSPSTNTHVVD